jgi:PAS domain S-box-containing protein
MSQCQPSYDELVLRVQELEKENQECQRQLEESYSSEAKFKALFDNSPLPIALTRFHDGEIVEVNDRFCVETKATKEQLIGYNTTDLFFYSTENRHNYISYLRKDGYVSGLEMDFTLFDGSNAQTKMFGSVINISDKLYIMTSFLNITIEKEKEKLLKKSEEKHRLLANNVKDIIWQSDKYCKYTYVSPSLKHMFGFSPKFSIGKHFFVSLYDEDIPFAEKELADFIDKVKICSDEELTKCVELRQVKNNGEIFWTEVFV